MTTKPDDDFIDITAAQQNPGSPAAKKSTEVDFDISGNQPPRSPAPARAPAEDADYTKTIMLHRPPISKAGSATDRAAEKAAGAAPVHRPRPTSASPSADASPATGGTKRWIGFAVVAIVVVVVWWVMRR